MRERERNRKSLKQERDKEEKDNYIEKKEGVIKREKTDLDRKRERLSK